MKVIKGWTAKRSGKGMTVFGTGEDGQELKVGSVTAIQALHQGVIAVTVKGATYRLEQPG